MELGSHMKKRPQGKPEKLFMALKVRGLQAGGRAY